MRRIVLPILVLAFLLAAMSSVSIADGVNEGSTGEKVNPADIIKILEQQKQEMIDHLWKEVKDSVVKKDYETAAFQLEEIMKLDETSEDAAKILEMLKEFSPQSASQWGVGAKAGDRKVISINGAEFAFRWCPPGTFLMGSPESEEGRFKDEIQHKVTLTKGFWMMETEVTQKQWRAVMGVRARDAYRKDELPMINITWNESLDFCEKCAQFGMPVQLPTEAQWEYACRAGTTGAFAGDMEEMTWYEKNSDNNIQPVGTKKPNAWGFYDMHGNVQEWCQDWIGKYSNESVTDPVGPPSGNGHIYRGGSNGSDEARDCRSACRKYFVGTGYQVGCQGFRCVSGQ